MPVVEFMICLECESPTYLLEFKAGQLQEAFCEVCGNDELDQFVDSEAMEALEGADPH